MPEQPSKLLLALLFVGVLMGALDLAIIGPALPAIKAEFGLPDKQLSVLINAYVLCSLISTPLLAKLSDRFGPRTIYIVSITLFAAGSLLLVMAENTMQLFAGRAMQGFGAGGIFPVATAVIAAKLTVEQRGAALGVLGTVFGVAFLVGPILGGILLRYSWHWLFLINLPIAAILIAGAIWLLPTAEPQEGTKFDYTGAALLGLGLTAMVFGLNGIDSAHVIDSLTSWRGGGFLLVTALLIPVFWRTETRASDPIIQPAFFASRQIVLACLITAGIGAIQSGGLFGPALIVSATGISLSNAAWLLVPGIVVSMIAAPIVGNQVSKIGSRLILVVSFSLVMCSLSVYAFADLTVPVYVAASIVNGLGLAGLLGAPLRVILIQETGPRDRAAGQGLLSVATSIGRLIGAAVVGSVATSVGGGTPGYQAAFSVTATLAGILIIVSWLLRQNIEASSTRKEDDKEAQPNVAADEAEELKEVNG